MSTLPVTSARPNASVIGNGNLARRDSGFRTGHLGPSHRPGGARLRRTDAMSGYAVRASKGWGRIVLRIDSRGRIEIPRERFTDASPGLGCTRPAAMRPSAYAKLPIAGMKRFRAAHQDHFTLIGVRCRTRFRLPEIVDSRLRGHDVVGACAVIPAKPVVLAKAGSGDPQATFRTSRTIRTVIQLKFPTESGRSVLQRDGALGTWQSNSRQPPEVQVDP